MLARCDDLALVILDPLSRLHGADENSNTAATYLLSLLEQICAQTGASLILAHHLSKPTREHRQYLEAALSPNAVRGASALTAAVRWQMNMVALTPSVAKKEVGLKEPADGFVMCQVSKKNYGPPEGRVLVKRDERGVLRRVRSQDEEEQRRASERQARLVDMCVDKVRGIVAGGGRCTRRQLMEAWAGPWKEEFPALKVTQSAVDEAISVALEQGRLVIKTEPNGSNRHTDYLYRPEDVSEVLEARKEVRHEAGTSN